MARRTLLTAMLVLGLTAAPVMADPPEAENPQDAVAAIKRILKRTTAACATDWARIDAVGYEGAWKVDVRIRESKAGKGVARWSIGEGWPAARNPLAKALARGCD